MTVLLEAPVEAPEPGPRPLAVGLPRVDLLPPDVVARRRLARARVWLGTAVAAVVALLVLLVAVTGAGVDRAQEDLAAEQAVAAQLTADSAGFVEVTRLTAEAERASAQLSELLGQEVRFSQLLDDLARTVPGPVWLTDVALVQEGAAPSGASAAPVPGAVGRASLSGTGSSHADVAAWLDALAARPGFTDVVLTSSTERLLDGRVVVDFVSSAVLTDEVLSGRWTDGAASLEEVPR